MIICIKEEYVTVPRVKNNFELINHSHQQEISHSLFKFFAHSYTMYNVCAFVGVHVVNKQIAVLNFFKANV